MRPAQRMVILAATGTARKRTIPALRGSLLVTIAGIHGRDKQVLSSIAADHDIPIVETDYATLLDRDDYDFVFVASPPFLHEEHITAAIERGKSVLCEKPLASDLASAERIVAAVRRSGVALRVAHHPRHQPGVTQLRAILDSGQLGTVKRSTFQWAFRLNAEAPNALWKLDPAQGGANPFFDAGVHAVDLAIHLFGEPRTAMGLCSPSSRLRQPDTASLLVAFETSLAEFNTSQSVTHPLNAIVIDGEDATLVIPHALGEPSFRTIELHSHSGVSISSFEDTNCYRQEVEDFATLLAGGVSPGTTPEEALWALRAISVVK